MAHDPEAILEGEIKLLEQKLAKCQHSTKCQRLKAYLDTLKEIQADLFPPAAVSKPISKDDLIAKLEAAARDAGTDRTDLGD